MDRQLQKAMTEYVHKEFDAAQVLKNIPVYVNISMYKNTKHFRLLSKRGAAAAGTAATSMNNFTTGGCLAGGSNSNGNDDGLLALVQLAFMNYDSQKNAIIAKAYVVNTVSADDFSVSANFS
ncbi:uncharacterized protein LOC116847297 [Odontomachus brunneus]|uniref:uncharacterized protein LOC116847297 n=1 Tax=Odontomachus brunneus TaxID=486640 RepID=UPI0013F1AABF|nr:uncharacterized protein LOC116847297 [Odontomachus brunneus]